MDNALLNHRAEVSKLAKITTNRQTQNKPMYAIDVNRWGFQNHFRIVKIIQFIEIVFLNYQMTRFLARMKKLTNHTIITHLMSQFGITNIDQDNRYKDIVNLK